MTYTKSIPELSQKIFDLLSTGAVPLGIDKVYYGAQNTIGTFPAAVVEGATKTRTIDTTRQYRITLACNIYVYFGKVQSSQVSQKEVEEITEAVEDLLNGNLTMDGLVIHGFVSRIDPGFASPGGVMVRATRLRWEGLSREVF